MIIFVLDHHPLVSEMISMLIHRIKPEAQVFTADSFQKLNKLIDKYDEVDFVFMEPQSADCFGSKGVALVAGNLPNTKIIAVTNIDEEYKKTDINYLFIDAHYIISKNSNVKIISQSIQNIINKNYTEKTQSTASFKIIRISKRHRQMINLLDQGCTNAQIADKLNISENTVKVHFYQLYKKLGARNRLQALNIAKSNGWVTNSNFV